MSSPSSRCRMRVIAWSSSARSWLMTSKRAAERAEEVHQPGFGVDVEVVRRFVEQQQLVAREQDARELDPPAFATGERAGSRGRADPRPGRARPRCGALRLPPRTRPRSRTLPRRSSRRARSSVTGPCRPRRGARRDGARRDRGRGPRARATARSARRRHRATAGPGAGNRGSAAGTRTRRPVRCRRR